MAQPGFRCNFSPFKILTDEQVEAIHKKTLRALEETGVRIEHEKALKLLEKNGCKVDYPDFRVRFPPLLVEECLAKCPRNFRVKARNPKNDIIVGENHLYFGTTPGMDTVDLDTWEPRRPTRQEFRSRPLPVKPMVMPQIRRRLSLRRPLPTADQTMPILRRTGVPTPSPSLRTMSYLKTRPRHVFTTSTRRLR